MKNFDQVDTPYLLLDEDRMMANIGRVNTQAKRLGIRLRPHVKSAKSPEITARMTNSLDTGITISTVREGEYFSLHGYRDFLLTTPMAPAKMPRVAALLAHGARFCTIADRPASIAALDEAAKKSGIKLDLLLEISVDDHRGGARLDNNEFDELMSAARIARSVNVRGLMVYPGGSMLTNTAEERANLAESHRRTAVEGAAALRAHGLSDEIRSFGSTSVLMAAETLTGLTEHRGGMYPFQDVQQAGIGWCNLEDISLAVASTIVAQNERRNMLFIDAGGLALSKDRSTAGTKLDVGYGLVVDPVTFEPIDDLYVSDVHQEHGMVSSGSGLPINFSKLGVGRVIAILPNHADITAAAYQAYHVCRRGVINHIWTRDNGW